MRARLAATLAGAAALLASGPGLAAAATDVEVSNFSGELEIQAAAGETNNVLVSRSGSTYIVTDSVAGVSTADAADCMLMGGAIHCDAVDVDEAIEIRLGDMNDRAEIDGTVTLDPSDLRSTILGEEGNDELIGGPLIPNSLHGHDEFGDGPGDDTLTGGMSNDQLNGSDGNDVLSAPDGFNLMRPGFGDDIVNGGAGSDQIISGSVPDGADELSGGGGPFDSVSYENRTGDVSISPDDVANDGEAGEGDNVGSDIERFFAGSGNDTIVGGPGDNDLSGGDGNDTLDGAGGDDSLNGGDGDDILDGGEGDDQLIGHIGIDTISGGPGDDVIVEGAAFDDPDVISGGPGTDALIREAADAPLTITLDGVADDGEPGENDNVMPDVEDVLGGPFDDLIVGSDADNVLIGNGGSDTLIGGGGADALIGGGSDYPGVGQGNGISNQAVDGDDTLIGGPGIDTLSGGAGADLLRTRDGGPDEIGCGSSEDTLFADFADEPSVDCDLLSRGFLIDSPKAKVKKGKKLAISASCPAIEPAGCTAKVIVRSAGKVSFKKKGKIKRKRIRIAKQTRTVDAGQSKRVKLKLTGAARKALARRGQRKIKATAKTKMTDSEGDLVVGNRKLTVKR